MDDKISQTFKVEWLNSTLKFIRNDNQLTMDYPKMPMAHVQYFHNSLSHREDPIGLGFRSLYAPLWDAISASSEKYEFKISIAGTESDEMGQLIIKKVPKNANSGQNNIVQDTIKTIPSLRTPKLEISLKKKEIEKKPLEEDHDHAITEICENSMSEMELNETVKTKPKKKTKSQKYLAQTKKIIESIAPGFFKTIFSKIYEFLNDKANASVTFSDLAPNEALFLQNFLGVYNRRAVFDIMFSPFCNDLLNKMAALFKEFDKQSKLDICIGKTDVKTSKREVTFLKVPRYSKITSTKAKLTININETQSTSKTESDNSGHKLLKALNKTVDLTNEIDTIGNSSLPEKISELTITQNKNIDTKISPTKKSTYCEENHVNSIKKEENHVNSIKKEENYVNSFKKEENHVNNLKKEENHVKSIKKEENHVNNLKKEENHVKSIKKEENYVNSFKKEENRVNNLKKEENHVNSIKKEENRVNNLKKEENHVNSLRTSNNILNLNTKKTDNRNNNITTKELENLNVNTTDSKKMEVKSDITKTIETTKTNTENKFTRAIEKVMDKNLENRNVTVKANGSASLESIKVTVSNKKDVKSDESNDKVRFLSLKDNIKKPTRNSILFEKANGSTDNKSVTDKNTDTVIKGGKLRLRHNKLLEAMSTPLESDKAMRMMRLMGWEGGALGLRGEGITEPIIPAINITPGAGLGHVSLKSQKKQDKLENRLQFLHAILNLITKDDIELELLYDNDISKKEKRTLNEIINILNSRKNLNLSKKGEIELCQSIHDKMADANFKLEIIYRSSRKITLKKTNSTDNKDSTDKKMKIEKKVKVSTTQSQNNAKVIAMPKKKTEFRILILNKVIKFLNEDEARTLKLSFDNILCGKHRNFVYNLCKSVNCRQILTHKKLPYRDLIFDLYENLTCDYFDLHYGDDFQSFTIEKVYEYRELTKTNSKKKEKSKTINEKSIDSDDSASENDEQDILQGKDTSIKKCNKKDNDTDKKVNTKDNNNNCNTKLFDNIETNNPNLSANKNKSFIILVEIEKWINEEEICRLITQKINEEMEFMPYLKNHGKQNGYLVYSCYNKKSCLWLKNVLSDNSLEEKFVQYGPVDNKYNLSLKLNINMNIQKVLSMLEIYHLGLNSIQWQVVRTFCEKTKDVIVKVDYDSYAYIRDNNFKLHAGFDEIDFSIVIPC